VGVEELYKSIVSKIVELQDQVTQPKSGLSLSTPRFRTRIAHLRGRLLHLTNLALFPSNTTTSLYQELHEQLDRTELNVVSLEMADQQGYAKDDPNDMYSKAQGTSGAQTHPSGKEIEHLGVEVGSDTGNVSTFNVDVICDTGVRAPRIVQARAAINTATSPTLGQGTGQVFTPNLYQRLPHPLSHLLKDLVVVDGADVNLLCDCLLIVL
jgi:hypothetical protein